MKSVGLITVFLKLLFCICFRTHSSIRYKFYSATISLTNNLHVFISSVMQFDTDFYLKVLYEIYLICIFVNINEYLKKEGKIIG